MGDPALCTVAHLTFSLVYSPHPLTHLPCAKVGVYTQWLEGGGGVVLSPVGDHILEEFNTLYLTRFRTYKIDTPAQTKI